MVSDIASIATAIGVIFTAFGIRQVFRGRVRQFEAMYVQRYWSILDHLSMESLQGKLPTDEARRDDERAVWAYLQLCEDELEMRAAGWISNGTFMLWQSGIREQLQQPLFREVLSEARRASPPLFDYLNSLNGSSEHDMYDPCSSWRRYLRGAGLSGI